MNILLINCSPVRNGATAEIVKTACIFLKKNILFTVFVLMTILFHSAEDAEPVIKQQNVYRKMMCQKSLRNLNGQIVLSVFPHPTGQTFQVNSKRLSTDVHRGATLMSHMTKFAVEKKDMLSLCALVLTCGNAIELLRVSNIFMGIWKLSLVEI